MVPRAGAWLSLDHRERGKENETPWTKPLLRTSLPAPPAPHPSLPEYVGKTAVLQHRGEEQAQVSAPVCPLQGSHSHSGSDLCAIGLCYYLLPYPPYSNGASLCVASFLSILQAHSPDRWDPLHLHVHHGYLSLRASSIQERAELSS